MHNWDHLLEQAEITLNLLHPSILNPRLLAYAQLNGEFDFKRTPTTPPVTITLVHDKPHNKGTWAPRRHKGWDVRPAMLHYRCLTSYITKTAKEKVSDTTYSPPATLNFPRLSSKDAATNAATDLTYALLNPTPTSPLTTLGNKQTAALRKLA